MFLRKHNETLDVSIVLISVSLYKNLVIETYTKYCTVNCVVTYAIPFGINRKNSKLQRWYLISYFI